jgi:NAD(P)-dependent dehydrogenase (short-subunit alcohol dehydrogenase family)
MIKQKTAIICGYGDLGKAIAKKFLLQNYAVIILSRNFDKNPDYVFFQCDISDPVQVDQSIQTICNQYATIDVLIFTAAPEVQRVNLLDMSVAGVKSDFETTVFGGFNILKQVGLVMKEQRSGVIIGVTSAITEENYPSAKMGAYLSAKYALKGMLRQVHQELVKFGVRVHALAPGFMRTKLNHDVPGRVDEFLIEKNPMKHMVALEELGDLALFLSSDQAMYLGGLSIPVAAGEVSNL